MKNPGEHFRHYFVLISTGKSRKKTGKKKGKVNTNEKDIDTIMYGAPFFKWLHKSK